MAATVEYGLGDGIQFNEDPDSGAITYTVIALCKDLDPVSTGTPFGAPGEELALVAQALSMVPARGSAGVIAGTVLLSRQPMVDANFPLDCMIKLNFGPRQGGTGAIKIRVGTQVEREETAFNYINRIKPLSDSSREPIKVSYDPNSSGAPGGSAKEQGGVVPYWASKSCITYERVITYDPSGESRRFTSKTNSVPWKGCVTNSVLCTSIWGDSNDNGAHYTEQLSFAYDPDELWIPGLRYTDPATGQPPKLTAAQVAGRNGVSFPIVQGEDDFNVLGL